MAIFHIGMGNNFQSKGKSTNSEINVLVRFGDFRIYRKICHHKNIKIAIADRKYFCHNKKRLLWSRSSAGIPLYGGFHQHIFRFISKFIYISIYYLLVINSTENFSS